MDDAALTHALDCQPAVDAAIERVILGLHPTVTIDGNTGIATFDPQPEHRGAPGWFHGGFAATLLDHFCARIASKVLDARVATGTLDLRYRQPVLLDGGPFTLTGAAADPGSRTVRVAGRIADSESRTLVEANALFVGVAPLS